MTHPALLSLAAAGLHVQWTTLPIVGRNAVMILKPEKGAP